MASAPFSPPLSVHTFKAMAARGIFTEDLGVMGEEKVVDQHLNWLTSSKRKTPLFLKVFVATPPSKISQCAPLMVTTWALNIFLAPYSPVFSTSPFLIPPRGNKPFTLFSSSFFSLY